MNEVNDSTRLTGHSHVCDECVTQDWLTRLPVTVTVTDSVLDRLCHQSCQNQTQTHHMSHDTFVKSTIQIELVRFAFIVIDWFSDSVRVSVVSVTPWVWSARAGFQDCYCQSVSCSVSQSVSQSVIHSVSHWSSKIRFDWLSRKSRWFRFNNLCIQNWLFRRKEWLKSNEWHDVTM